VINFTTISLGERLDDVAEPGRAGRATQAAQPISSVDLGSKQRRLSLSNLRADIRNRGTMIQAFSTALAGYSARADNIAGLAERIRKQPVDDKLAGNMVGMMVNQRAAEANLAVARVADETSDSLIHVIA
jgi:hypothetical protein